MRPHLPIADRTLPALLARHATDRPDATFVVDSGGKLSWGRALELARAQSAGFHRLGIERGDTVALILDNRRELLASWFGLAAMGAVEVPVNPANVGERLVHILNQARCREIVVQAEYLERLEAVADRLPAIRRAVVVGDTHSERFETIPFSSLDVDARRSPAVDVRFADPAAVMFTSGSTGPAKGVVLSHGQHYTNGHQPTSLFGIGPGDTVHVCLPLHHNMAQGYGVCVGLVSGAAVRIAPRFDADAFWDDVRANGSTILSFVGALLVLLAKRAPRADDWDNPLRVGFGVPIPADLHESFEERFGVRLVHCYGSTEATIVAWNAKADRKPGAVGRPLPDFDVCIMSPDDEPLASGQVGEICIRPRQPSSMFMGYFGDPESTLAAWRNLWFHTGDRGWFDADGDLWFSDRIGDVIRRLGEFVSSYEVEQAVVAHPDVQLAAAFGVPSDLIEEEVMLAVLAREGSRVEPQALRGWCAERLPRHAVPRFVELVKELPMTPTGKIEKFKLRERGVTATTDDARAAREVLQ
jgi:crotonobetaine/carnitine-CoA ligase